MNHHGFNPGARNFNPNGRPLDDSQGGSTAHQVSAPPSPYLEARVLNLEEEHADLRSEVDTLKDLYHDLCNSFGKVQQIGRPTLDSSLSDIDLDKSRQSAMQFKDELEQLSREVRESMNGDADEQKANVPDSSKTKSSDPPHVRAARVTSQGSVPSPPLSPITTVQSATPLSGVEGLSLKEWQPYYLTTLEALPADVSARIPAQRNMATFTFDMLQNLFGGISWSPGLRYINTTGACLLQNRTYYMLDPTNEPYLPKAPGKHGAKLSAFFNKAPEEEFDNLPEGTNSYTNVPLFVQVSPGRYAYYGNYSQTRWSDKLDNDTMKARVPQHVKDYMASELTAKLRDDWVTRELKKHFFPKPEYEGPLSVPTSDSTTINSIDEEKHQQQLTKDIKEYVEELAEWEREASMKIAMIKPDFILKAFDAADADDPPALRLWWEYIECIDWKLDFYNMLVGFQARADNPK
ncbi:hypothetical protein EJ07DRAFT_164701 [Lizonia empirigonia]|nr:hypothetical protein EJ07DRAFT_164701 [Lizonia empirigonia]